MVKNILPLIIVGLFGLIAGFSLLHKGLPPTHDGEYHVVRFYEFYQTLRDGNWYPRWASDLNNGYGIPLFNYVYPLPNYVASFFHFLGFSFIDSFKLNMFVALILGSLFFYLWGKGFWGSLGGMVGAIFYTYSPYHFLDIYIRGSVGEVWALAFFPAFLWSITRFIKFQDKVFFIYSTIFLALIIFSHNILALMFFPFALSYCGFLLLGDKRNKGDWERWGKVIFVFILGIGLSSIFWLPALFERQYVVGLEIFGFENHFPDLYQLIIPSWGSGFSGENIADQISFQIGIANLVVVLLSLLSLIFIFVFRHSGSSPHPRPLPQGEREGVGVRFWSLIFFFLIWFFIIFFLMLKVSLSIWQTVPFMNYFQFPWRLLSLEILVASFLAGSIVYFWKSKFLAIILIFLSFILGIGYSKPAYYHYRDDNYYLTRPNFIYGTNSPGNLFNTIWFNKKLKKERVKIKIVKGKGEITKVETTSTHHKFNIFVHRPSEIVIHTAYFPGWKVYVDESEVEVNNKDGIVSFFLPKGEHEVLVIFKNTIVRNIAPLVSIFSLTVLIFLFTSRLFGTIRK